jgi:hypothetical protein
VPMRSCCPLNLKKEKEKKEQKQEKWVYRHIKKNMHLKISLPNLCSHPNSLQNSLWSSTTKDIITEIVWWAKLSMSEDKQTFVPYFFSKTISYSTNNLLIQVIHSICIQAVNIEQNIYSLIQ